MSNQVFSSDGVYYDIPGTCVIVDGSPLTALIDQPLSTTSTPIFASVILQDNYIESQTTTHYAFPPSGNDTFMLLDYAQTPINKTIDSGTNTLTITNGSLTGANVNSLLNQPLLTTSSPTFRSPLTLGGHFSSSYYPGEIVLTMTTTATSTISAGSVSSTPITITLPSTHVISLNDPGSSTNFAFGPSTSTNGDLVSYNGTTGILQDSGILASSVAQTSGSLTATHMASFNVYGQIVDSGITSSAVAQKSGSLTNGDLASFNGSSQIVDSGVAVSNLATLNGTNSFQGTNTFNFATGGIVMYDGIGSVVKNQSDSTKQLQFSLSGETTGKILTLSASNTINQTITFPNTTGTLVCGPTTSTNGDLVSYNGTTGVIQDSGIASSNVPLLSAYNTWTNSQTFEGSIFGSALSSFYDGSSSCFQILNASDLSKKIQFACGSNTTGKVLTLGAQQSNSETLLFPNITGTDTVASLGMTQTFTGINTGLFIPTVVSVSSGTSLTAAQIGSIVMVSNGGSAYTINLPALASGNKFVFYIKSTLNAAVTITAPSACVFGTVLSSDGTAVTGGSITSAKTNVIIGTGAITGDRYEYYSDGTHYLVNGVTGAHGSPTFS